MPGSPPFIPTLEQRRLVTLLRSIGISQPTVTTLHDGPFTASSLRMVTGDQTQAPLTKPSGRLLTGGGGSVGMMGSRLPYTAQIDPHERGMGPEPKRGGG